MEFLVGALGAVTVLAVFSVGFFCGRRFAKIESERLRPKAEEAPEELVRQIKAEQEAFHSIQHYSADTAYGMTDMPEALTRHDEG